MPRDPKQPIPVLFVVTGEGELQDELDEFTARADDAYWHRFVRGPFTWRRFLLWWIARHAVVPRDVRRR